MEKKLNEIKELILKTIRGNGFVFNIYDQFGNRTTKISNVDKIVINDINTIINVDLLEDEIFLRISVSGKLNIINNKKMFDQLKRIAQKYNIEYNLKIIDKELERKNKLEEKFKLIIVNKGEKFFVENRLGERKIISKQKAHKILSKKKNR